MSVWKSKNKKAWTAKFKYQGRQFKKEGFQSRVKALAWEVQKREELQKPHQIHLTFSQVASKYLSFCQMRMMKNTYRQKAFVYRSFLTFLHNDLLIEQLTKEDFHNYLDYRSKIDGNCASNRALKDLKALFNWGMKQEILFRNPCINIDKLPELVSERYVPPVEDVQKVLAVAVEDDFDLLMVLYHTAGRISEIFRLTWSDINFDQRFILLKTRKRRGGELVTDKLPLTDMLFDVLQRRYQVSDKSVKWVFPGADGDKLSFSKRRYLMKRLCEKAGVKSFGFHGIRHHVASVLAESGQASFTQIQKLLRHKRSTTTDHYLKALDPQLQQVSSVLDSQLNVDEIIKTHS